MKKEDVLGRILIYLEFRKFGGDCARWIVAILLGGTFSVVVYRRENRSEDGRSGNARDGLALSAILTMAAVTTAPNDSDEVVRVAQGIASRMACLPANWAFRSVQSSTSNQPV